MTRVTQGNFNWRAKHETMLIEYASYVKATNVGYRQESSSLFLLRRLRMGLVIPSLFLCQIPIREGASTVRKGH